MDFAVFKSIRDGPTLKPCDVQLSAANGRQIEVFGEVLLPITLDSVTVEHHTVVCNLSGKIGIIGEDLLSRVGAITDHRNGTLHMSDYNKTLVLHRKGASLCARVSIARVSVIPPRSEMIVPGVADNRRWSESIGLIESSNQLSKHGPVMLAKSLVSTEHGEVPLRIANVGEEPIVLQRGTVAAIIRPVSAIDGNNDEPAPPLGEADDVPEHLLAMAEEACKDLDDAQSKAVRQLIINFSDVFAGPNGELGLTNLLEHEINTGNTKPIKQHPRRQAFTRRQLVDQEVQRMLDAGAIEPSDSPWASPIVIAKKKDLTPRFCLDYRALNSATVKDAFPLPRIDDSLDALSGAAWFSTLDLASGYWQVPVAEQDRPKTAFSTRNGLYQWRVMPFGLSNAPATFERLMELVLRGLTFDRCLVYLDDVIVFGRDFDDAIANLSEVLKRFRKANLKLKPKKCILFRRSVSFLGHVVSKDGVSCDPAKIEAVRSWAHPTTVTEARSFLGFASYYRRFIPEFSTIASPIHGVTGKGPFVWNEDCRNSFERLKELLISAPILAYPRETGMFVLDTDASNTGIGAVLSQVHEGEERVVAYASKALSASQRRYCTTMRELLAIVRFCEHFRHYLLGRQFLLRTDHKALLWLHKFKDPDGMLARWITALAAFDYEVEHRPGAKHANADGMSRRTCARPDCPDCVGESDEDSDSSRWPEWSTTTSCGIAGVQVAVGGAADEERPDPWLEGWSREDLQLEQSRDPVIALFIERVLKGDPAPSRSEMNGLGEGAWALYNRYDSLQVEAGLLYVRLPHAVSTSLVTLRLVTPAPLRKAVFNFLHSSRPAGHLGYDRTLARIRNEFFWHGQAADIKRWCSWCVECQAAKPGRRPRRAPLQQEPVGMPLERMAVDIVGPLPRTKNDNLYIVVIVDYFTKWAEAFPIPDKQTYTVAEVVVTEVVSRLGTPLRLHSDQGGEFESRLFSAVCELLGVGKTRTAPYRPQSDGLVERLNRTIKQMLRSMVGEHRDDWDDHLPYVMMAYRATRQDSTGCSPNLMMLGREARLPVEVMVGCPPPDAPACPVEYVEWVRGAMTEAFDFARKFLKKSAERQKKAYDNGCPKKRYQPNDWVWYLYRPYEELSLKSPWVGPCKVLRCLGEVSVEIQTGPTAKAKIVHMDYLKPFLSGEPVQWEAADLGIPVVDSSRPQLKLGTTDGSPLAEPVAPNDGDPKLSVRPPVGGDGGCISPTVEDAPEPAGRRNRRRPARFDDYIL